MEESAEVQKPERTEQGEARSDDSDNDEDDASEKAISDLMQKVSANPYQYDLHIQLITLLRKEGEFEKLREARESMSTVFPLTGEIWLEWIKDELKFLDDDKPRDAVEALFTRGVKDYLSIPLWLEYIQFCIGNLSSSEGRERLRDVCERAVTVGGLHVARGNSIWEVYRECENAVLMTMEPQPGSVITKEKEQEVEGQMERINNIFKRQLRVPLQDMEETLTEYTEWLGEPAASDVQANYTAALTKLKKYRPYEEGLIKNEGRTNLSEWQTYLEYLKKQADPATIRCAYERAVANHCLTTDLWLDYTEYLDSHSSIAELQLSVYGRAVRNCPWSPSLWTGYLHALEQHKQPHETVKETFEKSLLGGFTDPSDFLILWEAYIDYMKRRVDSTEDATLQTDSKEELRATIEKAAEYLSRYFGTSADPDFQVQQHQALVEAKYFKNLEKSRELWNQILASGYSSEAHMWMEYYHLERTYGDSKHCRKILHRAVNAVSDWPEQVCGALIMFERIEGSLDTLQSARRRVESQMKRVLEKRLKEQAEFQSGNFRRQQADWQGRKRPAFKQGGGHTQHRERGDQQGQQRDRKGQYAASFVKGGSSSRRGDADIGGASRGNQRRQGVDQRRPHQEDRNQKQEKPGEGKKAVKRKAETPQQPSEDLPKRAKQEDTGVFKVPTMLPPKSPKSPKSANLTPLGATPKAIEGEQKPAGADGKEEPMETSTDEKETRPRPSKDTQERTIFVKNLAYEIGEGKLREIFSKCGSIKEVRLVTNYQKKSKGFGYVEFVQSDSVAQALTMDRESIQGRPMYVDRYLEKEKEKDKKPTNKEFKYEMKMEKNKLFVSNLPRSATKEDLEKLFGQHGKLKEIRIVTYRSGLPKGLAYVEFENEADASKALISTDGTDLKGHNIAVAISNPPSRKQPLTDRKAADDAEDGSRHPKSLGAKGVSGPRGKGRTQLVMVPRSLQRTAAPKAKEKPSSGVEQAATKPGEEQATKPKMSNADFAKMFLKK